GRSGVGDGGSCNLKPAQFIRAFRCAREQQNVLQEQSGPNLSAPEAEPTPDYSYDSALRSFLRR
ncbi:MAG: hypothetical protein WCA40_16285, partial [Candidatus Acidiferrum sp.]